MSDLSKLRELAENATPGEWEAGDAWVYTDPIYPDDRRLSDVLGMKFADEERAEAEHARGLRNAEFIAAANPATVLALLDRLEAAERERAKWERSAWNTLQDHDGWKARAEAAEAKIAAVEALHFQYRGPGDHDICPADQELWPCPTVRALQESEGE